MPTETFTAGEDFVVPDGVFELTVELEGAAAQQRTSDNSNEYGDSGDGGRVSGGLAVTPGETLRIRSSPGGSAGEDGQEGGDSIDIRAAGAALSDRVAVAAGGGAGGHKTESDQFFSEPGGDGGADTGESSGGGGGTQTTGGTGDTDDSDGQDGSFGDGGDGGGGVPDSADAGGGGAGWYGGGGGAAQVSSQGNPDSTGGGGGSNYDDGLTSVTANERGTSSRSYSQGGLVTITFSVVAPSNLQITTTTATANDLSWDAPSLPSGVNSIDQYRIYRDTDTGTDRADYTEVATVAAGTTTYSDAGLDNGTEYYYRVGADLVVN